MKKTVLIGLMILVGFDSLYVKAQDNDYDEEHIASSLTNFSRFQSSIEFYDMNANENALYWVNNAKIEFGDRDYLNIELIGAYYQKDDAYLWTPGDFNVAYSRNYYSKNFSNSGWQGASTSLKLTIPTGNAELAGLFGHWILEPSVQYGWLLSDERFFIKNRWRVVVPIANAGNYNEPPGFVRFEPQFGYEDKNMWISATFDNRLVYNMDAFVMFVRVDTGFKINDRMGINAFYTKRIKSDVLFNTYTGVGLYYNF